MQRNNGKPQEHVGKILNVNDNEVARYLGTTMLRRAGLDVIEASSGMDALEMVHRELPDVVVLDVKLPDIDGFEVCRRIKANPRTAGVKILHTSATFVSLDKKVQGLDIGADGYLTQPFEATELVATVRSLLRLAQAERELRTRADRLAEADRRKDEFLAMLAHELRNPLAAITASLPMLEQRDAVNQGERRAREVLRRQTVHLARLVDDLLDVSRVTQGKIELRLEPVDLKSLLARVVLTTRERGTNQRGQTLALALPDAPIQVRGDVTRLEQIFTNLLDNASKYTDVGGHIRVSLEPASVGGAAFARIRVRDDGIGITADALPMIFGLFAQASVTLARSRGGLGIGLTLVRTLVELHDGEVEARSDGIGRGAEFEVRLPLLDLAETGERASLRGITELRRRRICIVEDNVDAQQALGDLCEMWGHEVHAASDGIAGVGKVLELLPDVTLIDIGLPGIDGFEVVRRLRADPRGKGLWLVALTGYGSPEQRTTALSAGFDVHLVKPVEVHKLQELLDAGPPLARASRI
ncbi:response regulator [Polyangium jinanense]|uniref:histidine kinase n=1 Tax=Polyangium jinanense TaxID=2829994 RepID=A0A9X3X3L6_9BACT|nr:response regulator [Polyangium jinanense]MDC3955357.1 response regulator [Polyangium jinanense]MDC3981658.1 response regulator [Polyangium jinanense]